MRILLAGLWARRGLAAVTLLLTTLRFWAAPRPWLLDAGGSISVGSRTGQVPLYWHADMCSLARVEGRCPQRAGEALIDPDFAATLDATVGDTVSISQQQAWIDGEVSKTKTVTRDFRVVGTYRVPDPSDPAWGDSYRFIGDPQLLPPPPSGRASSEPRAPALLVAQGSMTSQTFFGGADRALRLDRVNIDTAQEATALGEDLSVELSPASGSTSFALGPVVEEVDEEQSTLSQVTLAAGAPLAVLGLLLIHGLIAAGAQQRRAQVALARLRGHRPRQVAAFAMAEPTLIVLCAIPLGVGLAWVTTRGQASWWLAADTPISIPPSGWIAAGAVVVAAIATAALAVGKVLYEPLSRSLGASEGPTETSRWSLVGTSMVIALAVAVCLQVALSDGAGNGGVLEVAAPVLASLAMAIAGRWLLMAAARRSAAKPLTAGGTARKLAVRRLARRADPTSFVIALALAACLATYSASAWAASDDWNQSRAAARVGAAERFVTDATPEALLEATRRADPDGKYVAAAVLQADGDGVNRQLMVDTTRLSEVITWDPTWSDHTVEQLQEQLQPRGPVGPLTFSGERVSLKLASTQLTDDRPIFVALVYRDQDGKSRSVTLGEAGNGQTADWRLDDPGAWRPARPYPVTPSDPPVTITSGDSDGLRISVYLDQLPPADRGQIPATVPGRAGITPNDIPDVTPALVVSGTPASGMPLPQSELGTTYGKDVAAGNALDQGDTPIRVVAWVDALPVLGDEGVLVDLSAALLQPPSRETDLNAQLLVAGDTPPEVLDDIRDAGIALAEPESEAQELDALRHDAFALGWRIVLLICALTVALSIVGVWAQTATQRRWRDFETASMLSVGVRRRTLLRAAVIEHALVIGVAAISGLLAAWLSVALILPTVGLGPALPFDPAPDSSVRWLVVAAVGALIWVAATSIASLVSTLRGRRITTTNLPWEEQQVSG